MQSSKISCSQCPHYARCPQKTRTYVNYCGADQKKMAIPIRAAVLECRARKGRLFIQEFFIFPDAKSVFKPALVGAS
jgi:hypothetical protein